MLRAVASLFPSFSGISGVLIATSGVLSWLSPSASGQIITSTNGSTWTTGTVTSGDPIFTWLIQQ